MLNDLPIFSIIIPTRNRIDKLSHLLIDINEQNYPKNLIEVIIADDFSDEDPLEAIKNLNLDYQYKLLRLEKSGPAIARNKAFELSKGDYLLFLNDDIQINSDLLISHIATHNNIKKTSAVLGTFQFLPEIKKSIFARTLENYGFTHTPKLKSESYHDYQAFWTCNISIHRKYFIEAGGFDEEFKEPACEDLELGYRLQQKCGISVYHTIGPKSLHNHIHDPEMWQKRNILVGKNGYKLYKKHGVGADLSPIIKDGKIILEKAENAYKQFVGDSKRAETMYKIMQALCLPEIPSWLPERIPLSPTKNFSVRTQTDELMAELVNITTSHEQMKSFFESLINDHKSDATNGIEK